VIPAGAEAFILEAEVGSGLMLEPVEGDVEEDREIVGACYLRRRESSSRKAMASTQWRRFSMPQWPRTAAARGWAVCGSEERKKRVSTEVAGPTVRSAVTLTRGVTPAHLARSRSAKRTSGSALVQTRRRSKRP